MSTWHFYIKPFANDDGTAYADDWTEVTKDVADVGALSQQLDNTEYDVGIFRNSNFTIKLQNEHGHYSDIGGAQTMFLHTRGNSKVNITWEPGDYPLYASFFTAGAPDAILTEEVDVFEGLLSDINTKSDIDSPTVELQVLGYDSAMGQALFPYDSVNNGDTYASLIYATLNQSPLNEFLTVSSANISPALSATCDSVTTLRNKTALEAVKLLLAATNSTLYLLNGVIYVAGRTARTTDAFSFYGPASTLGIENITDISEFRSGLNRVRNFWSWKSSSLFSSDASSIDTYGVAKKEISYDFMTSETTRQALLNALLSEFYAPKREMILTSYITSGLLAVNVLDRVQVDYPYIPIQHENESLAYYGRGDYGTHYYADSLYPLFIESGARFKVMGRKINFDKETIAFHLREVPA